MRGAAERVFPILMTPRGRRLIPVALGMGKPETEIAQTVS